MGAERRPEAPAGRRRPRVRRRPPEPPVAATLAPLRSLEGEDTPGRALQLEALADAVETMLTETYGTPAHRDAEGRVAVAYNDLVEGVPDGDAEID